MSHHHHDPSVSRATAASRRPTRTDHGHPQQMRLSIIGGRTIARHTLLATGLTEELLCRLELAGLLSPIAGTNGRQFNPDRVADMWREVAHVRRVATPTVDDIELVIGDKEARDV
jgi:hypothetical protein